MAIECDCELPTASHAKFELVREVGVDETEGRFAAVDIKRCRDCGAYWLRYSVEYEAFSRSGRWARGRIEPQDVEGLMPEDAPKYLEGLSSYIAGGSYFGGVAAVRHGRMHWGL
ncbi:hypothetical protein [Phenylobacterium sp.]|uniref:hypothetical protein n=1 Tax=Phenylobacterium sp. TaxID=1871053 RepID=UPI0035AD95D4